MIIQILGVDEFTSKKPEVFSVEINLTKDNLNIIHEENCIKIYHNDEYYVTTKEGLELIRC